MLLLPSCGASLETGDYIVNGTLASDSCGDADASFRTTWMISDLGDGVWRLEYESEEGLDGEFDEGKLRFNDVEQVVDYGIGCSAKITTAIVLDPDGTAFDGEATTAARLYSCSSPADEGSCTTTYDLSGKKK